MIKLEDARLRTDIAQAKARAGQLQVNAKYADQHGPGFRFKLDQKIVSEANDQNSRAYEKHFYDAHNRAEAKAARVMMEGIRDEYKSEGYLVSLSEDKDESVGGSWKYFFTLIVEWNVKINDENS